MKKPTSKQTRLFQAKMFPRNCVIGPVEQSSHGKSLADDDDRFYYHSWRNNVVIAVGTLSSFLT